MKYFKLIPFLLIASVIPAIISCCPTPRQRTAALLDDVESYINARPDSARVVLENIDSLYLKTPALRARYSLLHVMALDKCYDDITAPGLLDPAVAWYGHHGSPDEKMKTCYYQGRIAQEHKDSNGAAVYYSSAEEYSEKITDKHALGLLYLAQASIYNSVYNSAKEEEYCEKGLAVFRAVNDSLQGIAMGQLAISCFIQRKWDRADSLFTEGIALSASNPYAMSVFLPKYAVMKLLQSEAEPEEALKLLDRLRIEYGYPLSLQGAGAYAYALILSGKEAEAKGIIEQLEGQARSYPLEVEPWLSRCALASGDFRKAYESLNKAHLSEEVTIQDVLKNSVSESISGFNEFKDQQKMLQGRIHIAILIVIILILTLGLTLALLYKNKLENEKSQILNAYTILEKEAAEQETQTSKLQLQLNQTQEKARQERVLRFRQAGRLRTSIWRLEHRGPSWIMKDSDMAIIKEELSAVYDIDDDGKKLVSRLNRELDGAILPLLDDLSIKDKPQEQLFLCCCLLNLPADIIAAKFGITSNNVRVKKSRLKSQIKELDSKEYDALFDIRR